MSHPLIFLLIMIDLIVSTLYVIGRTGKTVTYTPIMAVAGTVEMVVVMIGIAYCAGAIR